MLELGFSAIVSDESLSHVESAWGKFWVLRIFHRHFLVCTVYMVITYTFFDNSVSSSKEETSHGGR